MFCSVVFVCACVCVCLNVFVWSCVRYRVMLWCAVCIVCGCCLMCLCGLSVISRVLLSGVCVVVVLCLFCVWCVCVLFSFDVFMCRACGVLCDGIWFVCVLGVCVVV